MDKAKAIETIDNVVKSAADKFPNFAGVVIFGSFTSGEPNPRDIDLMPVYYTAKTDDSQTETRKYLVGAFPKLPEDECIANKYGLLQDSIYHVADSAFLEDLDLKYLLAARRIKSGSFHGNSDAKRKIEDILSKEE